MARPLSDDEVSALGLEQLAPAAPRALSDEEVQQLGLEAPAQAAAPTAPPAGAPGAGETFLNEAVNAIPFGKQATDALSAASMKGMEAGLPENAAEALRWLAGNRPVPAKLTPQAKLDIERMEGMTGSAHSVPEEPKEPTFGELFRSLGKERAERTEAGAAAHPVAGKAGTATGTALGFLAPMPGVKVGTGAGGAVASGAINGGLYGGAGDFTGSEELAQGDIPGALKKGAEGLAFGSLIGGPLGLAGEGIAAAPGALRKLAEKLGLKATGATGQNVASMMRESPEALKEMQQVLVDRGHVRSTPEKSMESIEKDLADQAASWGAEVGLDPLSKGALKPNTRAADAQRVTGAFREQAGKAVGDVLEGLDKRQTLPSYGTIIGALDSIVAGMNPAEREAAEPMLAKMKDHLLDMGTRPVHQPGKAGNGFEALNSLKTTYQRGIDWNTPGVGDVQRKLVSAYREAVDGEAGKWLTPDLMEGFKRAKAVSGRAIDFDDAVKALAKDKPDAQIRSVLGDAVRDSGSTSQAAGLYPRLAKLADFASRGASKEQNSWLGLLEMMGGLAGGLVGAGEHGGGGAGIGIPLGYLAIKEGRKFGPWAGSHAADILSRVAGPIAKPVGAAVQAPGAVATAAQRLRDLAASFGGGPPAPATPSR